MSDTIELRLQLNTTDSFIPLGAEVWIDNDQFYNTEWLSGPAHVSCQIPDTDAGHILKIILKNKKPEHTTVDESGNVVSDVLINVTDVSLDGIDIQQIVNNLSTYNHNFNGNGDNVVEKFNGSMGCNGTVSMEFSTPGYLWLLENI